MHSRVPCLTWLRHYHTRDLISDANAALIVTVLLIPQSLAYALLAGLPAEVGLYASIAPLLVYALFGSSRVLAVGPVAISSLMTAAAVKQQTLLPPVEAAMWLALLAGGFLLLLGLVRGGFLADFISHPVMAGFMAASGILIAVGQLAPLLGLRASGASLPELLTNLLANIESTNYVALALGGCTLILLLWTRHSLTGLLLQAGMPKSIAATLARLGPVLAVVISLTLAWHFELANKGLALLGDIPTTLPRLRLPPFSSEAISALIVPALLIAIISYVESVAVARTLAAARREKIEPNQELVALGSANISSALSGGFPVAGGFARSVVNFDAGAQTQMAGVFTAGCIALATLWLGDVLAWLPHTTLAATIIVAVLPLVKLSPLKNAWRYSRSDFAAVALTMGVTLLAGVEIGVGCGVVASLVLHLYRTSRPHIAEVGEVAGTEHFRNVERHAVQRHPSILSLRVDESLYFANASYIEDYVLRALAQRSSVQHVVLMCSAVNTIDMSALEVLEALNRQLREARIGLHFSEVKGPVMDRLRRTDFLQHLNGQVFLSQHQAIATLTDCATHHVTS